MVIYPLIIIINVLQTPFSRLGLQKTTQFPKDTTGGGNTTTKFDTLHAMDNCDAVIVLVSPRYCTSVHCRMEELYAWAKQKQSEWLLSSMYACTTLPLHIYITCAPCFFLEGRVSHIVAFPKNGIFRNDGE
jgi:hypothetical protein